MDARPHGLEAGAPARELLAFRVGVQEFCIDIMLWIGVGD